MRERMAGAARRGRPGLRSPGRRGGCGRATTTRRISSIATTLNGLPDYVRSGIDNSIEAVTRHRRRGAWSSWVSSCSQYASAGGCESAASRRSWRWRSARSCSSRCSRSRRINSGAELAAVARATSTSVASSCSRWSCSALEQIVASTGGCCPWCSALGVVCRRRTCSPSTRSLDRGASASRRSSDAVATVDRVAGRRGPPAGHPHRRPRGVFELRVGRARRRAARVARPRRPARTSRRRPRPSVLEWGSMLLVTEVAPPPGGAAHAPTPPRRSPSRPDGRRGHRSAVDGEVVVQLARGDLGSGRAERRVPGRGGQALPLQLGLDGTVDVRRTRPARRSARPSVGVTCRDAEHRRQPGRPQHRHHHRQQHGAPQRDHRCDVRRAARRLHRHRHARHRPRGGAHGRPCGRCVLRGRGPVGADRARDGRQPHVVEHMRHLGDAGARARAGAGAGRREGQRRRGRRGLTMALGCDLDLRVGSRPLRSRSSRSAGCRSTSAARGCCRASWACTRPRSSRCSPRSSTPPRPIASGSSTASCAHDELDAHVDGVAAQLACGPTHRAQHDQAHAERRRST